MTGKNIKHITGRKIRIGVVGCGRISASHFKALQDLQNSFELCAVCDSHPEAVKAVSEQYGVAAFRDLNDMLNEKLDLDVVVLCSPSGRHAEQTLLAASKKVHIITEKPMATRWSDGVDMVKACEKAGVHLFVVKQNRYQPSVQMIKNAILSNRFGRIYLVNLNVFWTRPQHYYDQARWRGTWEFDGGALMNQASHYVDLLDWLIGPVESVQAMMSTLARTVEVEDTGILNIRWRSGALGSMAFTMLTYPKNFEASLTILGEKGTVRAGGFSADKIDHWEFDTPSAMDEDVSSLMQADVSQLKSPGHRSYYENVSKTLQGISDPDVDGRAGLRSLEILVAAYLSSRDRCTVSLPLVL